MISLQKLLLILGISGYLATKNVNWAQFEGHQKELQKQQSPKNTLEQFNFLEEKRRLKISKPQKRKKRAQKKERKAIGPRFLLKRIQTSQSNVLTQEEINAITRKYEGHYLRVTDLMKIVEELNRLYEKKLGGISRAVLPPQKIEKGLVRIILVESKIGKVIFEGIDRTSLSYLKWALPIEEKNGINIKKLEKILTYFNKTHNNIKITSRLKPGKQFRETDIIIRVKEFPLFKVNSFLDNHGPQSTGSRRYGLTLQNNSPSGIDDQIILGFTKAPGSLSIFSSYDVPLGAWGTRIKTLYSKVSKIFSKGHFLIWRLKGNLLSFLQKSAIPFLSPELGRLKQV